MASFGIVYYAPYSFGGATNRSLFQRVYSCNVLYVIGTPTTITFIDFADTCIKRYGMYCAVCIACMSDTKDVDSSWCTQ